MGISVEFSPIKQGYNTNIAHPSIGNNGIKDNLSVHIYILQFMPCNTF